MPKYNYLKGNESPFPNIDNVNTYKYDNSFDYGRFDAPQMELMICTVPWDMGEAHIGNRTISGIGNVVYFGSREERDKWFDAIPDEECYRFTTKFKELHRSLEIDVPVPYDMCAKHNYLVVRYAKFANEDSPIQYEGDDGLREWFWFVREVEFLAPSTTRLHLLDDAFQTWIYDINVSGMLLERGHAPMFQTRASEYLENPIGNNVNLLTEDVNYGMAGQVKHSDELVFNDGDMYACFAVTADPVGSWGTKDGNDWKVPTTPYYNNNGQPSVRVFGMPVDRLNAFLSAVTSTYPQFKQTVQGVFFASSKLVTLGAEFTFANVTCYSILSQRKTLDLCELTPDVFGYDGKYADIAKLYTYPYAQIEVTDENGNVDVIHIEDTAGKIQVSAMMSLAYPFITVDAHLIGVGGAFTRNVTYRNISAHTFDFGGQWYETLRTWQVPTFAVVLDPAREYDYSSHFDRAQQVVDYTAAQNNANASADTLTANAALSAAANTAITARSNQSATDSAANTVSYNDEVATNTAALNTITAISTIAANQMQGAISATGSAANAAVGAAASAAQLDPIGAVSSIANGVIGAATTMASVNVANGQTSVQAGAANTGTRANASSSNTKTNADTTTQTGAASDIATIQNGLTTGTAANSSATQKANAARTANAAQSAIDNGIAQAALNAPSIYGSFANGDGSATKPQGLFANIVTQSKSAIAGAGDEFLRYGYMLERQWDFNGDWNVGKYFTYWKLRDFWVSNLNVPDMYMDKIRFFLFGGVTVWRRPEYIGHVSVYDNFNLE